jgi:hypothetical protein
MEETFQQLDLILKVKTSNPDEIVNLRNIPIFGAKFAGWLIRKNAIMTIAIQSDGPLNIKHSRLFSKASNQPDS